MAAGLAALLDDVAVLARAAAASVDDIGAAAAKAGAKAAGVVIDDAAVTPQYVRGLAAERELPIVRRIALGSLRNKFLIILPVILLLSEFLPWALTPLLMIGGAYLCYEGAEKVWERIAHRDTHGIAEEKQPEEKVLVAGAIRTDLILSAEIMVISLNEVASESFARRLTILSVVAILMTILVYGAVGLIVKMDDVGLKLSERDSKGVASLGRGLVKAMPKVLTALSVIGTAAMLWVGGHILLLGTDELGFHPLYEFVHHVEVAAHDATGAVGGVVGWLVNTLLSAVVGLIVGAVIVAVLSVTLHRKGHGKADDKARGTEHGKDAHAEEGHAPESTTAPAASATTVPAATKPAATKPAATKPTAAAAPATAAPSVPAAEPSSPTPSADASTEPDAVAVAEDPGKQPGAAPPSDRK